MSILYYSNFCKNSDYILQKISKMDNRNGDVHFICVDKRVKEKDQIYLILENNSKIPLPATVTHVPALFLLNKGCEIIYGENILSYFRPREIEQVKQATNQFMEPQAFSLSSGANFIVSDQFSFLDMDAEEMTAVGNGGMRQMHNYVDLSLKSNMETFSKPENDRKENRMSDSVTIEKLQQMRQNEEKNFNSSSANGSQPRNW